MTKARDQDFLYFFFGLQFNPSARRFHAEKFKANYTAVWTPSAACHKSANFVYVAGNSFRGQFPTTASYPGTKTLDIVTPRIHHARVAVFFHLLVGARLRRDTSILQRQRHIDVQDVTGPSAGRHQGESCLGEGAASTPELCFIFTSRPII